MSKTIEEIYKKKTQYEHIIDVPDTYIGSVEKLELKKVWVFEDKMIKKDIEITPGFYKIFDEILVNAIDHYTRKKHCKNRVTEIKIDIEKDGIISVYNDGPGIDIQIHKEHKCYVPELIFGFLLTSTNYNKNEKKITGGKNGYGAKLTNIFSKKFIIETVDSKIKKKYRQTFTNNMLNKTKPKITNYNKKSFTKITFLPDYEKFEMKNSDNDILCLLKKRVYDICACTDSNVKVYFNKKLLNIKTFDKYCNLYIPDSQRVSYSCDRWDIIVSLSDDDKLEHVSFVNGVYMKNGGKHIDYISKKIARKLAILISKKLSTKKDKVNIKQQYIIDNLMLFIRCDIDNPDFGGQSKNSLTTSIKKFGSECNFDDKFFKNLITKKFELVDRVIQLNNYKNSKNIVKNDKKRKKLIIDKLDDANFAGTNKSHLCTLILTEGDSAKTSATSAISAIKNGSDIYGVFPLKGKIMNVRKEKMKKILNNKELMNIKDILGLQFLDSKKK